MIKFLKKEIQSWQPFEVAWLLFCEASIIGLSVYWESSALGIIAASTGMAYTVFAGKGKISCFIFGLINTPLYAYLAWEQKYFGDMALNIYYFCMMFPGILAWRKNMKETNVVVKSKLSNRERSVWGFAILVFTILLWFILSRIGGNRPICDALTNVLSISAMILTIKRCIEQWVMWTLVNLIEIFMWWHVWIEKGNMISILLMWTLFLINGIFLFYLWQKDIKKSKSTN